MCSVFDMLAFMSNGSTRRIFMGAATAASAMRVWGAGERISVAIVGLGGRGSAHLNIYSKLPEARVVALCDVNQAAREKAQATLLKNTSEKAKEFEDMREMFADPKSKPFPSPRRTTGTRWPPSGR